ncbi:MAG: M20/M25/M40 family metallo-hydrolase [Myxococcales bacterium]|nr:M20/M25/M40 family metallo-hydrolase [Myxococcales bacterium]
MPRSTPPPPRPSAPEATRPRPQGSARSHATFARTRRACGKAPTLRPRGRVLPRSARATYPLVEGLKSPAAGFVPARCLHVRRSPANVRLFEAYAAQARAVGLGSTEAALIAGGSDASSTSQLGIPSIDGLGPQGKGFHTKDELIEIASLEPKALTLARLLAERCS